MQINVLCPFQLIWVYKIFRFYDLHTKIIAIHFVKAALKINVKNKLHVNEREAKSAATSYYKYNESEFIAQDFYDLLFLNH